MHKGANVFDADINTVQCLEVMTLKMIKEKVQAYQKYLQKMRIAADPKTSNV